VTQDHAHARKVLKSETLLDQLAAAEHERWAHWQQYVHDHCTSNPDGSLTIPAALAERWSVQIKTPYSELSDQEKESDRDQVRRYLPIIQHAIGEQR
jgi:hypothetical protein